MLPPLGHAPYQPPQLSPGFAEQTDVRRLRRRLLFAAAGLTALGTIVAALIATFTMLEPQYWASALLTIQAWAMAFGGAALVISTWGVDDAPASDEGAQDDQDR